MDDLHASFRHVHDQYPVVPHTECGFRQLHGLWVVPVVLPPQEEVPAARLHDQDFVLVLLTLDSSTCPSPPCPVTPSFAPWSWLCARRPVVNRLLVGVVSGRSLGGSRRRASTVLDTVFSSQLSSPVWDAGHPSPVSRKTLLPSDVPLGLLCCTLLSLDLFRGGHSPPGLTSLD